VVSQLVYAATGADVRDVIIDGKWIMRDRQLLTLNEDEILRAAVDWGNRIKAL
jgi:5-methylthioadenosine/S-adenosylhomocysteine deaminase